MNKILALAIIVTSLYGISALPVNAQAVFGPSPVPPMQTKPVCQIGVLNSYVPYSDTYNNRCECPAGSTYQTYVNGFYTGTIQYICIANQTAIPACLQSVPGMSYITVAVQCQCPNGTTVWSNGGYTNQCVWNTQPVIWNINPTITCWDGSTVSAYQTCPQTYTPTCSYYQYWNGYQCVNMYQTIPYQQTQYQYYQYNTYQQSTNWFNQNNATNFGYSYSNGVWIPATAW